jgi:hypothetical protein
MAASVPPAMRPVSRAPLPRPPSGAPLARRIPSVNPSYSWLKTFI